MAERLNWLIYGAGAIGTYIGGSLILHGQKVVFLELPPSPTEIIERGLKLNINGQEHRILHPDIYTSLEDALSHAAYDIAIFAIKSYDTQLALELMRPLAGNLPPVLCLQNGVENEPAIELVLGSGKVIAGTVTSAIRRRDAGDILLERLRGIGISSSHQLSPRIVQALSDARLNARLYPSAPAMKWSKMLTNLLANASSAILDMTPAEILHHPGLYAVEVAQLQESIAVMHAQNLPIVDLPGTPVKAYAWVIEKLSPSFSQPLISRLAGKGRGKKMPSFHIDLHSNRGKSEVDFLNGAVVRFGEKLGIATPVNHWLNHTLLSLADGRMPMDSYTRNPEKYLENVRSYVHS